LPQAKENVRVRSRQLTPALRAEFERLEQELGNAGRILVRPSGTEPVVRILVEAENSQVAGDICGRIASLVLRELG
jgi:phosphoglucosamine mutase